MSDPTKTVEVIEFEFTKKILELLGKQQYTNPWAAVSELVANGLDAGAPEVYVAFNKKNNSDYDLYVIDNGSGMNSDAFKNKYMKIGFNKRDNSSGRNEKVMGRKGIGKLAALSLSNHYIIITKTESDAEKVYELNYNGISADEKPGVTEISDYTKDCIITDLTKDENSYTIIYMKNVNLSRMGSEAFNSLGALLANHFAADKIDSSIFINHYENYIPLPEPSDDPDKKDDPDKPKPLRPSIKLQKEIAYNNMLLLYEYGSNQIPETDKTNYRGDIENIKVPGKKVDGHHEGTRCYEQKEPEVVKVIYDEEEFTGEITGWFGIHASIKGEDARKNDIRFIRNKYYRPTVLRVYVRNKLAISDFLPYIANTQTYANYIEGEIHFDLLDDDRLPDIASASRQDMMETDERVIKLQEVVQKIVTALIYERNIINSDLYKKEDKIITTRQGKAKKVFVGNMKKKYDKTDIKTLNSDRFIESMAMEIQGDNLSLKEEYILFFSHASETSAFSNFIYQVLKNRGARLEEMFYSSDVTNVKFEGLNEQIRRNITKDNAMIIYFITGSFIESSYCMFEGGAGWATKTSNDIVVFTDNFSLLRNSLDFDFLKTNIVIDYRSYDCLVEMISRNNYANLVKVLNAMINHLNKGREILNKKKIKLFEEMIPTEFEIKEKNQSISDYVDETIKRCLKEFMSTWCEQRTNIKKEIVRKIINQVPDPHLGVDVDHIAKVLSGKLPNYNISVTGHETLIDFIKSLQEFTLEGKKAKFKKESESLK